MDQDSMERMKYKHVCSVALMLVSLLAGSEATCSRRYSSPNPDCSTGRLRDGRLSDTHIPCFAVSEDGSPRQLEFPDDNTQTCYRTCIDPDLGLCQASLVANTHNKDLVVGVDFKLSVFSQGFQRVTNQKYRKSSICRYNVKCPEGQILSYSMDVHKLEEPASCGTSGMSCLDSLTLFFPGMASSQTSCGTNDDDSTNSDGSSELLLEFISNRQTELNGFLLLAWCVDPTIKDSESGTEAPSRESRGAEEEGNREGRQRCTSFGWGRDDARRNESDSLQILAGAFRSHSKKILDPSAIHITVDVFDHVTFKNRTVFITQRNGSVMEFPGIHKFHLSNRLVNDSVFRFSAPGRYHGYGYIVMWQHQAFFLQDGINPEYRPTEQEQKLIEEFQIGLREAVVTNIWEEEEEGGSGSVPPATETSSTWTETTETPSTWSETTETSSTWTETTETPSTWSETTETPSTWTETTETPSTWSETTETPSTWTETTETPSTWSETTETPSTWSETTETPSTWSETTETPSTWSESTETPSTWSETTETPSTWSETTETPSTWSETTETPSTWSESTETPSTWSETTETPSTWSETTETPSTWTETTETPSTWTETTETPSTWSETTETPSTWTETTETPSTWTETTETPSTWSETTETPSTWTETTETPSTWTETTETPSTWTETTETSSTWTETTETSSTWSETTETSSTWSEKPSTWKTDDTPSSPTWEETSSDTTEAPTSSWAETETPSTWKTPDAPSSLPWAEAGKPSPAWAPLVAKARRYSTACNALLRSAACAYLKLVAGENCPSVPSWEQ